MAGESFKPSPAADADSAPATEASPSSSASRRARRLRIALWVAVFVAMIAFLRFDTALMRWRYAVLPERAAGFYLQVLQGLRDFAQVVPIVVATIIVGAYDARRRRVVTAILVAQLLAGILYNSGKLTVARYRPNAEAIDTRDPATQARDTWIGWQPGNTDDTRRSFPSGHSAAAFAFAGVLAWFYPRLRWLFWTLAVGCAVSRVIDVEHWPSDCLAGAMIGYAAAWLTLRMFGGDRHAEASCPTA